MHRFSRRIVICAAVATAIIAALEVVGLYFGSKPATEFAGQSLANTIFGIAAAGLICGTMFALSMTFEDYLDRAWEGEAPFAIPLSVRFAFGRLNGIFRLVIGASGVLGALNAITREIYLGLTMGIWHTVSFCESIRRAGEHLCPVKVPVFSWVFNAPAFLVLSVIGIFFIRQGLSILSDRPEAED